MANRESMQDTLTTLYEIASSLTKVNGSAIIEPMASKKAAEPKSPSTRQLLTEVSNYPKGSKEARQALAIYTAALDKKFPIR